MGSDGNPQDFAKRLFEAQAQKLPLTPAMRRAIRRDRKRWIAFYVGLCIIFAAIPVITLAFAPANVHDAGLLFYLMGLGVGELALIGTLIWKLRRLDRDARGGVFLRIAGKVTPISAGASPSYGGDASARYITIDGMTLPVADTAALRISLLTYATIDLMQFSHEVIEARDQDEKVVYRLPGYYPVSDEN